MAAPSLDISSIDLISPDRYVEFGYPHDAWKWLRANDPVRFIERDAGSSYWAVTRHADILEVGKDPGRYVNGPLLVLEDREREPGAFNPPATLIQMDPPKHGAFRQLISRRFTPRALKKIEKDIHDIAFEIVDDLFKEGESGECDFVRKISAPLPIAVIAWLLGVPRSDWERIFDWTNAIIGGGDPEYQRDGDDQSATANNAMMETFQYLTALMEEKKKNPADDIASMLVHAEIDGQKLEPMEVLSYYFIIIVAGNETTRNATSGGMLALIEHQDQLRKLQQNPDLLPSAIEEILRWTSPIIHFARTATEDCELRGRKIRKGDQLGLFYPSANRDEDVFENPYDFDISRPHNRHIAFGIGEHFCAGAHVARLELEMAFKYLVPRIAEVELNGDVSRLRSHLVGGVKHLPIRYRLTPAGE
ncbi:MAG: cytochrome P450 [Myxococcota bacterium]|nr:cytochrome P450 [Myxococcota bacterium]